MTLAALLADPAVSVPALLAASADSRLTRVRYETPIWKGQCRARTCPVRLGRVALAVLRGDGEGFARIRHLFLDDPTLDGARFLLLAGRIDGLRVVLARLDALDAPRIAEALRFDTPPSFVANDAIARENDFASVHEEILGRLLEASQSDGNRVSCECAASVLSRDHDGHEFDVDAPTIVRARQVQRVRNAWRTKRKLPPLAIETERFELLAPARAGAMSLAELEACGPRAVREARRRGDDALARRLACWVREIEVDRTSCAVPPGRGAAARPARDDRSPADARTVHAPPPAPAAPAARRIVRVRAQPVA